MDKLNKTNENKHTASSICTITEVSTTGLRVRDFQSLLLRPSKVEKGPEEMETWWVKAQYNTVKYSLMQLG